MTAAAILDFVKELAILAGILFTAWKAWRAAKAGKENAVAIQEIHISLNSRLTELLSVTKSAAHAEGVKEANDKEPMS